MSYKIENTIPEGLFDEDEDLFAESKPKAVNQRKSNAVLYVYKIIRGSSRPLTQKEILQKLAEMPWEVRLERKALGRIIHGLCQDPENGIVCEKGGIRFDPSRESAEWAA